MRRVLVKACPNYQTQLVATHWPPPGAVHPPSVRSPGAQRIRLQGPERETLDADWRGIPGTKLHRKEGSRRCDIPLDVAIMHSAEDHGLGPHLLKAGDELLAFLLATGMTEELPVSLHSAVNRVSPRVPQDGAQMELIVPKSQLHMPSPNRPEELRPEHIPGRVHINHDCRGSILAQIFIDAGSFRVGHKSPTNIFPGVV